MSSNNLNKLSVFFSQELREERSNLEKELLSSDFSSLPVLRDPVDRSAEVDRVDEDLSDDDVLLPVIEVHHRTSPPIR